MCSNHEAKCRHSHGADDCGNKHGRQPILGLRLLFPFGRHASGDEVDEPAACEERENRPNESRERQQVNAMDCPIPGRSGESLRGSELDGYVTVCCKECKVSISQEGTSQEL